jgi:conjugative relaxase-like TrwC/TraI family protein
MDAFRESVRQTMNELEADVGTRVRKRGKDEDRTTGNMVWGEFIHTTARPVDGVPDPYLHAHCFVFNTTCPVWPIR